MTSTNDGKEVKSIQTSGPKGKTYFIELYKSLEARLSEAVTASERTKHLCEAWRKIHSLCLHSAPTTHPHLLSWIQRHTARAVLQTKWQSVDRKDERASLEEAINIFIVESKTSVAARDGCSPPWQVQLVARGEWFKRVLDNPWKHPVLNCLLNPDGTPPTNDEVLEWLKEERGVTFVMRLHTLVAEKCDDIAMSLATAVMERVRGDIITISDVEQSDEAKDKPENKELNFGSRLKEEAGFTTDVWELLIDIEFVLLHKRDSSRCIALAKQTPLRSAYQLIERLQGRLETSPREKRLWKNSKEVAVLIAQVVIARCMVVPQCAGGARSALYCCARSLARLLAAARLPSAAAALAAPAPTAAHLHTLAAAVDAQLALKNEPSIKPFVCELYVRAITAGMNELERLKLKTEKDTEARSMEQTLASWFVQLGAVLGTSDRVKCECALTAFSVHPSPQMYERIKAAPLLPPIHLDVEQTSTEVTNPEFGSWASDSRSQTNFVKTSETLNMKARQNQANVLSTAILTEGEALGLSPELCQDITVLLSGPRVKTLSWDMDRDLLLENCRGYLERTHGGTKAVTTELKYLNLNPADYQDLPEEDEDESNIYYGIEKGYEHLVEFQEPEDIWEDAYDYKEIGSSYSSDEFDFIQPQQRKRRTKTKQVSNTEEDDPLSLVAENKRKEKKERPHSKERSKDKKKNIDPLEKMEDPLGTQEGNQEKKEKPKRVRKKKVKPTDGSLANLVGLKVGKVKKQVVQNVLHTGSDTQSANSDDNIVYDGTYSMDDMRSPKSLHSSDSMGILNNDVQTQVGIPSPNTNSVFYRPYRPPSVSGVRIASSSPAKSQSPSERSRNNSPTFISDEVKNSISKLLEFRRQKAVDVGRKKQNAIIRQDGPIAMDKINISPKAVAIPEIPKSYINKQGDKLMLDQKLDEMLNVKSSAIPSPVIQYAKKSPAKPSQYHGRDQYNMHVDRMTPSADRCFSTPPSADRFLDSVNLISIYDKNDQMPKHHTQSYDKTPVSDIQDRQPNDDMSYINYQDYLHEFSLNSFNEYAEKSDASKNIMRPTSRVTPVVPNIKVEHKTPQSAKNTPLKKPDGSLNTFSRLSYYKNKQTDMRNKSQNMSRQSQPRTVGSKLDGFIMDHLFQTQNRKPQSGSSNAHDGTVKYEKPHTNVKDHPMLTNILQTETPKTNEQKLTSSPKSGLSEKDHNDLILLLRQQSMLNKPQNLPVASHSKSGHHDTLNSPAVSSVKTVNSSIYVYNSNDNVGPSNHTPNHLIGKPDEAHKNVEEGKIINILSTSIIKSADQKTKNPKSANTKKPGHGKSKKTEASKKPASKPESHKDPEEWENVMNAILKQKTPYRGPNALAIALNKSSFEKAFEDSLRKPTTLFNALNKNVVKSATSRTEFNHEMHVNITKSTTTISQTILKTEITTRSPDIPNRSSVVKKSSKTKKPGNTPVEVLMKQNKIATTTIEKLMRHNRIEITKSNSCIARVEIPEKTHTDIEKSKRIGQQQYADMSKINIQQRQVEMSKVNLQQSNLKFVKQNNVEMPVKYAKQNTDATLKKETKQAVHTQIKNVNYAGLKQNDISAIPNSDYDLLDELIDDDLRKEIGELSSDEDSYNAAAQNFLKPTKTDEKRANVMFNQVKEISSAAPSLVRANNARPSVCKQSDTPPSFAQKPVQRPQTKKAPENLTPAKPSQSNPIMCLNATNEPNIATRTVTYSTQVPSYNSASFVSSNQVAVEPNVYIAAVPRPLPVQNVMLIPTDLVYEGYSTVQTPMQNIAQNTYVSMNNASSANVYQATQFGAPVINPLVNTTALAAPVVNNVPCVTTAQQTQLPRASQTQYSYSSHELHQSSHLATVQGNIVVDGSKLDAQFASNVVNRHVTDKDIPQQPETKTPIYENVGKSGERKVLKEVQEKHADEMIECKIRSQKVNDTELKTQASLERVKEKRMAILNRKVSMLCGVQTIALGYSPLKHSTLMEKKVDLSNEKDSIDDLVPSTQNNLPDLTNEVKSSATRESFKENKNESKAGRRILLRSSNKQKSKVISSSTLPKPSLDSQLKELPPNPLHTSNETLSEIDQSNIETTKKEKRVLKRIRDESPITPKDANKKEINGPRVKTTSKKNVRVVSGKTKNLAPRRALNTKKFFDIETELVGSTISKLKPVDLHDPSSEINSTASTKEKIEESLMIDKKETITLKSKEKHDELLTPKTRETESPVSTTEELEKSTKPDTKDLPESLGKIIEDSGLPCNNDYKSPESTGQKLKQIITVNKNETELPESAEVGLTKLDEYVSKSIGKIEAKLVLTDNKVAKSPESTGEVIIKSIVPDKKVESVPVPKDLSEQDKEDLRIIQTIKSFNHVSSLKSTVQDSATPKIDIDFTKKSKQITGLTSPKDTDAITSISSASTNNVTMNEPIISVQPDKPQSAVVNVNGPGMSLTCSEKIPPIEFVNTPTLSNANSTPIKECLTKANLSKHNVCRYPNVIKDKDLRKSPIIVTPQACATGTDINNDDDDVLIIGDFPIKPTPQKEVKNTLSKSSENSIIIENITDADDGDPLKKTVRMKLGNGKTFKGTVSGSVDINALLDDPGIKSLLMTQFQQPKKLYSLKLNVNKGVLNGNKILSACIQHEIKPQTPLETVSLLSDDEEEESSQIFETEFGKHKIDLMSNDLFKKHQSKFKLKSCVLIKKLSLEEESAIENRGKRNVTKNTTENNQSLRKRAIPGNNEKINLESFRIPVNSNKILNNEILSAIPSKYVHGILKDFENIIVPPKEQPKAEPIVLIDDSSNESVDTKNKTEPVEKIDVLKTMLLKDLGVEDNILPVTRKSTDDVQVTWASEAIDLTDDSVIEPSEDKVQYKKDYQQIIDRKCFVKLVRCDDKIKQLKRQSIEVENHKTKVNDAKPAPVQRTGSFSLLENLSNMHHINEIETKRELIRTSPVMEIYDLIASLKRQDLSVVSLKCETEWRTTKKDEYLLGLSIKHKSTQTVTPTLATTVLSFIQKVDLINRYIIPKTRSNLSHVSLKRKSKETKESYPVAKMFKFNDLADKSQANNCNLLSTSIKETDANYILAAIKTDEELKTNKNIKMDDLDVTPDLSDIESDDNIAISEKDTKFDVTNVSAPDINGDDNIALSEKETELDVTNVTASVIDSDDNIALSRKETELDVANVSAPDINGDDNIALSRKETELDVTNVTASDIDSDDNIALSRKETELDVTNVSASDIDSNDNIALSRKETELDVTNVSAPDINGDDNIALSEKEMELDVTNVSAPDINGDDNIALSEKETELDVTNVTASDIDSDDNIAISETKRELDVTNVTTSDIDSDDNIAISETKRELDVTNVTTSDIDSDDNIALSRKETELDVTNVTASNIDSDDNIALSEKKTELDVKKVAESHTGINLTAVPNDLVLPDTVTKSRENSVIDSLGNNIFENCMAKSTKEHTSEELAKEIPSKPSLDIADDITIDSPNAEFGITQIEDRNLTSTNNDYNTPNHLLQAESKNHSIICTKMSQNTVIEESHSDNSSVISMDDVLLTTDQININETHEAAVSSLDISDRLINIVIDPEKECHENENVVNNLKMRNKIDGFNYIDEQVDSIAIPIKENIVKEIIDFTNNNALVHTEIEESSYEPKIDLESSKTCVVKDNSTVNLSDTTITSQICEKTNLKATINIEKISKPDFKNMSDKSIGKRKPELNVPEYTDQGIINMRELDDMKKTKLSNTECCFEAHCTLKQQNQNTTHEIKFVKSRIAKENCTNMNSTLFPKSVDEINEALNKMFGEPEHYDQLVFEKGNLCNVNNSEQKVNTIIPLENKSTKKCNTNLSRTIDEIDDDLKEIFGETEDIDSTNLSEVVTSENVQCISTMLNNDGKKVEIGNDYNCDPINASLREGLTLIEDSNSETVVEGTVDMLNDEIIDDIAIPTLNCTRDVSKIERHCVGESDYNSTSVAKIKSDVSKLETLNQEIATKSDCENTVADLDTLKGDETVINDNVLDIFDKYLESNGKVEIKGIQYEDPVIGTRYVFSVIEEISEIDEQDGSIVNETKENVANNCEHDLKIEDVKLIVPKHTYSYSKGLDNEMIRRSSRNMKRKKDMIDIKTTEKKYRKGKNIDYPKLTASAIAELTYAKEYKRIMDYCSTITFSYARPFHIDNIDVGDMLKTWPINNCPAIEVAGTDNAENRLYRDTEDTENGMAYTDPLNQTLNEEIVNGENINDYKPIDIIETNFNMGFGERSGRVIQTIETGITKLSAATLSDVKQYQPFSKSEVSIGNQSFAHKVETQKVKIPHVADLINLKEKVRSFFKKSAFVLHNELLQDKKYDTKDDLSKFPFGLTSTEFMEPPRGETIVNVVQVGQMPVSATVQNPVTCDPRVTQVSDASPSQCSDNSTGEDSQTTVKTEYTELTTADITLPLVQEYAQNIHHSPLSREERLPGTDDNMNETTQTLSIVKIELMEEENSQEKQENEIYDNAFSPLPNNNIEYSFEDTSNTIYNTSANIMHNPSNKNSTSNHIFDTSNSMDNTYTNMFNSSRNMDSAYTNLESTPSSTDSSYTNMDNASTSMYSTSPNVGSSSSKLDNTANMDDTSSNMDNTYINLYNPMRNESNDGSNTTDVGSTSTTHINSSPINMENRSSNVNMENTAYDYTYENIEDYAANIENNNNANNYSTTVNNYAASVENYTSNVDNYTSNVENYATNGETYPTAADNYSSNVESYSSNVENYSTNGENYSNNIDSTNSNVNSSLENIDTSANMLEEPQDLSMANSSHDSKLCNTFEDGRTSKPDQIAHAMNAAGISSESVITSGADELANLISSQPTANNYSKASPINVVTLQQALAQVLTPPNSQTSTPENQITNNAVAQQVLHIVQGNNAQTVINKPNGTHLLHIVQNKNNPAANGLSLVDTGLQQGGNQLIHIVNNSNQNSAQFLKRVNLLTNLTNAQGSNEQKMIQFVCKSADGKSIQLNAGHQRSMVLRLHPTTVQNTPKPTEPQDVSPSTSSANSTNCQDPSHEMKSPSVYEENYAQFVHNSGPTPSTSTTPCQEKSTSLPKFNQVFGKQSYQENQNEMNHDGIQDSECPHEESNGDLEQTQDVNNTPLLVRSTPPETTQAQPNPAQQIKQTMSPMNIHTTMHGGVIYTRQIPVNIGGGQTINLITVPSTELVDDSAQKQQPESTFVNQEGEQSSIIKLVPHHAANNPVPSEENNTQAATSNETNQAPQSQPVLTQMRIKLPMLSKGPHIVPGARLMRPSFFQIQRNVIAGTNQPVYQQLVLTTAPSLGQTLRLPAQQAQSPQAQPILVQSSPHPQSSPHIPVQQVQHAPSSQHVLSAQQAHSAPPTPQPQTVQPELSKPNTEPNSELSNLTLEQLREFDMVLEQVKERSVQPAPSTTTKPTPADSTDGPALESTSVCESTQQVLYSIDNSQPTNVLSYVNRKSTITSATTSYVRSPDSSGIVDTPSSSTQVQITHTVTTKSSTTEGGTAVVPHPKKKKKKKPSSSSSTLASLGSPPKPNPLKPQEDEQTTQRILYILAEYKEQVENSPDKNKPAPRRRNQFAPATGSKRKRSKCSSRSRCRRVRNNTSPTNGEHGDHGEDSIAVGSEDSNGTTFSECTDCQENPPEDSPTKVVRRLTFEQHETTTQIMQTQTQSTPQRNVIVGDRQTITVARTTTATTAKPTATVLMPANYLLPVSMLKGGQQIAIMTNRGPRILVGAADSNGALLFQRLIGPGLKPILAKPGVRHIRVPATALHNLQAFNIQTTPMTQVIPPDSTASQAPGPPDLVDMRAMSSPWQDREAQDNAERGHSPDCTEPWNMPSSSIADDYGYEEIVRTDNMERTVLDAIPDRYSPDNMEAQQIFDKMFDVDSKKSMYDSSRCGYDIDTSDGDDNQQVVQHKDGKHHRVTHVSTAALRHKYAILEHEMRLQKSLSEECEDLGVDSPSASELFPEADILFGAPSPAHEQTIDHCNTPPPMIPLTQSVPQPDLDDQIATDQLLTQNGTRNDDLDLNDLDDVGEIVTVGEDGVATIPTINAEEFARSHPNTTFHTEPEDGEIPPFTIAQGIKGRHITFHSSRTPGTVVMAPQTTVISQATVSSNDAHNTVKFIDIDNMINSMPCPQPVSVPSVLVKDTVVTSKPPKSESVKDSGTSSRSSSKYDQKEPSHRSSSKSDSQKESRNSRSSSKHDSQKVPSASSSHRSSSKFDSLKEPSSSRSTSKFDSLKDSVLLAPKPLSKFDSLLTESKLHLSTNTSARQVVHSTGHGTQVIRRLRYDERTNTKTTRYYDERERSISDEVKMRNDRAMVESMGDNASSPGQPELFWDSTTSERHERRFHFSECEKVAKSPFDELLNDSSAYGPHTRLDSVIKAARPERMFERTSFEGISGSSDEGRPLRTYPPKRAHTHDTERHFTLKTTTMTTHHHESDRSTMTKTTHHHELDRGRKMPRCQEAEGRRRTGRGLVKRNCSCCNGSSAPPKKRSRPKKSSPSDFTPKTDSNMT